VGGALSSSNAVVYQRFISLAGDKAAKIAVVPAASGQPVKYFKQFLNDMVRYGLASEHITLLPVALMDDKTTPDQDESTWRDNAMKQALADDLSSYTAVWFLGGDQLNITAALRKDDIDTPLLTAIHALYQRGGVIGGTSAGAAIMSEVMIAAGDSWGALTQGLTDSYNGMQDQENGPLMLSRGLGFFSHGIIDQHFDRKARFGRLIVATELNKARFPLGFGIDEDSALVFDAASKKLEAIGNGAVTLVDVSQAQKIENSQGYQINNVRLSILQGGDMFDLTTRQFEPQPDKLATVGSEYLNIAKPVVSGVFSRNTRLKDMLTFDLVDNKGASEVVSYLMQGEGIGFTLRFSQDEQTQGYWQYLDGLKDNGSAYNVKLSITPSRFSVTELAP
ncbi:cyanophycinase, partial [Rheinheimera baltica]|uniref:cyanophycinase n=1 Tax=Rheinheimera baltica TaxID=67576 RepID=UPI00273EA143